MVELKALYAGYDKKEILHGITMAFAPGKVTVIVGPNGCGKSTLLKTVIGINKKTSGDILVDKVAAESLSARQMAQKIAYLPQNRAVPDITVLRMVLHGRFAYLDYPRRYREQDIDAAKKALRWVGLEEYKHQSMASLSGGMQQNAYIAMALAQDTPTVLMDEPTAYLDISNRIQTMQLAKRLADEGKAVVMVLHDLDMAMSYADNIAVMSDGKIIKCGTAEEVFESGAIDNAFNIRLCRIKSDEKWIYHCQSGY